MLREGKCAIRTTSEIINLGMVAAKHDPTSNAKFQHYKNRL